MGISVGIVWHKMVNASNPAEIKQTKKGLGIFVSHMGLNMAWTILFFGLQLPELALVEIIVLWFFIVIIILQFKKVSKLSAWLLVPYILWVTFASVLNASIVYLN